MTPLTNYKTFQITQGSFRGLNFKVNHPHDGYKWAYYLYIRLNQIKNETAAKSLSRIKSGKWGLDYSKNRFVDGIWMHAGCTYANYGGSIKNRYLEVGCDYGHYHDDCYSYNLDSILSDVEASINSVHETLGYNIFCNGAGGFFDEKDGSYNDGGSFYSNQYREKQKEQNAQPA